MRRKIIAATAALIGVSSIVVWGSTPKLVENLLESVQSNPITKIFSTEKPENPQKPKTSAKENPSDKQTDQDKQDEQSAVNVPDNIIYLILFNHLVGLKDQADQLQKKGETSFDYHEMYRIKANLTEAESVFLFQTAQDCMDAIKPIDEEAKRIILEARAAASNDGEIESLERLPPPPAILTDLQQQHDATILQHKDALQNTWGVEKFSEFDRFVRQKIAPEVTPLSAANLKEIKEVK
jgi:hypothetical protein